MTRDDVNELAELYFREIVEKSRLDSETKLARRTFGPDSSEYRLAVAAEYDQYVQVQALDRRMREAIRSRPDLTIDDPLAETRTRVALMIFEAEVQRDDDEAILSPGVAGRLDADAMSLFN